MSWHFNKTYKDNPAQDGEKYNTKNLIVKSNSCSDCVSFTKDDDIIEMEIWTFRMIYEDLKRIGAL